VLVNFNDDMKWFLKNLLKKGLNGKYEKKKKKKNEKWEKY
jgi:hypothetical protein